MHKLSTLLGMPQHRFASIHVVGTNGKSSVTRMTAALLEAHGVSAGACVSPHAERWSERVLIHGREIGVAEFAVAVERAAVAAETVNRTLEPGEAVTQFELATAASFVALANARVGAAAIEAGLGGRLDATNTIPSRVTVLASVGLDHTEWLGESEAEIAAEKLAVLRDHTTLVVGRVSPAVRTLAERTAAEHGATLIVAPDVRLARAPFGVRCSTRDPAGSGTLPASQLRPRRRGGRGLPRRARSRKVCGGRRGNRDPRPARAGGRASRRSSSTPPTIPTAPAPWPKRFPR